MDPAGFEWTMTLAAGREHYLFGGHDSLYARCSGFSRQSLWLGQIGRHHQYVNQCQMSML